MSDAVEYVVFDKYGSIIRYGNCPGRPNLHLMADPMLEEYIAEGYGSDLTHEVNEDFEIVLLPYPIMVETSWKDKRRKKYPKIEVFADAHVKMNSNDSDLIAEGTEQLKKYYQDCLKVKIEIPKE